MNTKITVFVVAGLLVCLGAAVPAAQAQPPCSLNTLNGSYGFFGEATLVTEPPVVLVTTGMITFDGAGNLTGESVSNVNGWGAGDPGTFTGYYTVNPDCTYSGMHWGPGGEEPLRFTGVITGSGIFQETHFVVTEPGWVALGTVKKMPPGGCSLGSLKGSYALSGGGTITANVPPLPYRDLGIVIYDGAGNFYGSDTAMVGGLEVADLFTGNATVTEGCAVSIEISTTAYGLLHAMGWITGEAKSQEFHFIYTDPGLLATGTLKKQ